MTTKKTKRKRERVVTRGRQRVLRKSIPHSEIVGGVVVVVALMVGGGWVAAQRDNYDPADRDVSMELLTEQSVVDTLWQTPLKRWVEPGQVPAGGAGPDLGVFPPSILGPGMSLAGSLRTFEPDTLYEKINGQAEQYLKFDFRRLHFLPLTGAEGEGLDLYLFDQGELENSLGVFSEQRSPEQAVEAQGDVMYVRTATGAFGIQGPYFFQLVGSSDSDEIQRMTERVLGSLGGLPTGDRSAPPALRVLQGLGVSFDGIGYEPINVFQYAFAKDFWFGRPDPDGTTRYFLHTAASPEAATELFDQILKEHQYEYEVVVKEEDRVVLKHEFLDTFFTMEHRGPLLFGVDDEPVRERAEQELLRLEEALGEDDEQETQSAS